MSCTFNEVAIYMKRGKIFAWASELTVRWTLRNGGRTLHKYRKFKLKRSCRHGDIELMNLYHHSKITHNGKYVDFYDS